MQRRILLLLLVCALLLPLSALADITVTMSFTGDVTLGGENKVQKRADSFTGFYNENGPDYFFANVLPVFQSDDLTVINLEGTLTDSSAQENTGKTYRFRAPTSYVDILTRSSIEYCSLANNHRMDFGDQGYSSTTATLDAAGVAWACMQNVYIYEKESVKIAFFSLHGIHMNTLSDWVKSEIKRLKEEEGVSMVIFSLHCGTEYDPHHTAGQKKMAHHLIDYGADLIIMHHPHVVEGVEVYNNRYIFYSLGNFCFGGNCEVRALETILVQGTFTFSNDGQYLGQQMSIYPCNISGTYPNSNFQPLIVTGAAASEVIQLVQNDTDFDLEPLDEEKGCIIQPYLSKDGGDYGDKAPSSNRH